MGNFPTSVLKYLSTVKEILDKAEEKKNVWKYEAQDIYL